MTQSTEPVASNIESSTDGGMGASQDGLGRLHLIAVAVIGFGSFFEVLDLSLTGVFGVIFAPSARAGGVAATHLAWLLAATSIGAVVGSPLFGWWSDRSGRRTGLMAALLIASAFSILAAFTASFEQLIVTRLGAALGIGAYMPIASTYLAETVPSHLRGRLVMLNVSIGGIGGAVCGLLTRYLDGSVLYFEEGWRSAIMLGGIGCFAVGLAIRYLPEPAPWLVARGRHADAQKSLELFARNVVRFAWARPHSQTSTRLGSDSALPSALQSRRTILTLLAIIIILQLAIPWSTTAFANFTGWVFVARGYSSHDALSYQSFAMLGISAGPLIAMLMVDRIRRSTLLIGSAFAIAIMAITFTASRSLPLTIACGFAIGMLGSVHTWALILFSAENFPTLLRARTSSIGYSANRASSITVPFVLVPLLAQSGEIGLYAIMACAMVVSGLILWTYRRVVSPALS